MVSSTTTPHDINVKLSQQLCKRLLLGSCMALPELGIGTGIRERGGVGVKKTYGACGLHDTEETGHTYTTCPTHCRRGCLCGDSKGHHDCGSPENFSASLWSQVDQSAQYKDILRCVGPRTAVEVAWLTLCNGLSGNWRSGARGRVL